MAVLRTNHTSNPVVTATDMDTANAQTNANTDAIAAAGGSPLTTAGDLIVRGAAAAVRKPVGTDGQVLRVNTANADKLEWATLTADSTTLAAASGRAVALSIALG